MTTPRSQAGYAAVNGLEMYYEIHHHRHEAPQVAVFVRPWVDMPWGHAEKIPRPNCFKVASSLIRFRSQRRLVPARGARLKNGPPAEGDFARDPVTYYSLEAPFVPVDGLETLEEKEGP